MVSTESAVLGLPADIAIDETGNLYVVDVTASQLVVLTPAGELVRRIGREGRGPGEFQWPRNVLLTADSLRVVDQGNLRLQTLTRDGGFGRQAPLPSVSSMGHVAVRDDGAFLITTLGVLGILAAHHAPSGEERGTLGTPLDSVSQVLNPAELKKEVLAGRMPGFYRNGVLPAFAPDGAMWLILTGEGQLQRYGNSGTLELTVPLEAPELQQARDDLVARVRASIDDPRVLPRFSYVHDAVTVGRTLWLLLNSTADGPAVLLAYAPDGTLERRVVFPEVRGAQSFAFDPARGKVYFGLPASAAVVSSSLPDGVLP